jgi:hypothetical protein
MPNYSNLPTSALVGLAGLILKRARRTLPCNTREQAISVIRSIRPAPPRNTPIPIKPIYALCSVCYKPLIAGEPCDSLGRYHIQCQQA